jgi:hypothetical protein
MRENREGDEEKEREERTERRTERRERRKSRLRLLTINTLGKVHRAILGQHKGEPGYREACLLYRTHRHSFGIQSNESIMTSLLGAPS